MAQNDGKVIRAVRGKAPSGPEGMEQKKIRIAAYCRVSTLREEQEESFETQKRAYEGKLAEAPGLVLAGIYADRGISGGSIQNRAGFQRMMQDCRDGKIDLVMTKSISRFARNLADTLDCIRELRALGIPVQFDREGIDTMDPSSDMLLGMLAAVAQEEINSMSQNIKWAHVKSWEAGNPKQVASYGYRIYMAGGRCEWGICEPEAERIRLAFDMADRCEKFWKILCALQEMEDRDGTEIVWNQQRLHRYLTDKVYVGDRIAGKSVSVDCLHKKTVKNRGAYPMYYIEGHHEPLVSREQFERVQENMKSGGMKADWAEEIPPDRYKSTAWKRKHGQKEANNNQKIFSQLRGCCTERGKGAVKDGEKCLYGRHRCHGCPESGE